MSDILVNRVDVLDSGEGTAIAEAALSGHRNVMIDRAVVRSFSGILSDTREERGRATVSIISLSS